MKFRNLALQAIQNSSVQYADLFGSTASKCHGVDTAMEGNHATAVRKQSEISSQFLSSTTKLYSLLHPSALARITNLPSPKSIRKSEIQNDAKFRGFMASVTTSYIKSALFELVKGFIKEGQGKHQRLDSLTKSLSMRPYGKLLTMGLQTWQDLSSLVIKSDKMRVLFFGEVNLKRKRKRQSEGRDITDLKSCTVSETESETIKHADPGDVLTDILNITLLISY